MAYSAIGNGVMNRLSVLKIDVSGFIYMKILWEENPSELFKIQLYKSDNSTWSGSFTYDAVTRCREHYEIENEKEYNASVKEALTGVSNFYFYVFDIQVGKENIGEFKWKKKIPDSDVVVEHGRVSVKRDEEPTPINALIDILIEQNHSLTESIEETSKSYEGVLAELEQCKQELDNFIDTKISLEESIYGKFIQLLNEKKKRIVMLEEALMSME